MAQESGRGSCGWNDPSASGDGVAGSFLKFCNCGASKNERTTATSFVSVVGERNESPRHGCLDPNDFVACRYKTAVSKWVRVVRVATWAFLTATVDAFENFRETRSNCGRFWANYSASERDKLSSGGREF